MTSLRASGITVAACLALLATPRSALPQATDLVLAIDHSSSMEDNDPGGMRFRIARRLLEPLEERDTRVGLVLFGGTVDTSRSLPLTSELDSVDARLRADPGPYISGTDLNATLAGIDRVFSDTSAVGAGEERRRVAVVITDGEGALSPRAALAARDRGYVVHTVGLAIAPDSDAEINLRTISTVTGADYIYTPDQSFLERAVRAAVTSAPPAEAPVVLDHLPERIGIRPARASATVGTPVDVRLYLLSGAGLPVLAHRDYDILVSAEGASLSDTLIRVSERDRYGSFTASPERPGPLSLSARTSGGDLEAGAAALTGCEPGDVERLILSGRRETSLVPVRDAHPLQLVFADSLNTPVADGRVKVPELTIDGVGELERLGTLAVPEDECEAALELYSDRPGRSEVRAELGTSLQVERTFTFVRDLSFGTLVMAALGGVLGAFVRAYREWSRTRRWGRKRWSVYCAASAVTAVALLLFSYYVGLRGIAPNVSSSTGFGVLVGLVAGYAGPMVFDRMSSVLLPGKAGPATDVPNPGG